MPTLSDPADSVGTAPSQSVPLVSSCPAPYPPYKI
jgi:hypothetical protein